MVCGMPTGPDPKERAEAYWRANLRVVLALLTVWFVVSFGFGILLAPQLDRVRLPGSGFRLGFWFAQQGSIYVFVLLIFVYVFIMNRIDRRYDVDE
jgi:putative solute:sodium symporter small subunit